MQDVAGDALSAGMPAALRAAYGAMPPGCHGRLMALRAMILDVAAADDRIGPLEETLKWGEPAYLPRMRNRGSTVRLAVARDDAKRCALYFNCNTGMVALFRSRFPELDCRGDRAVLVACDAPIPGAIALCIATALTWHLDRAIRSR